MERSQEEKALKKKTSRSNTTVTTLRNRALELFQKMRRMQCANSDGMVRCISCGKVMHWKEAQGGHYVGRRNRAVELEPDNVWAQCERCNGFLGGNPVAYRRNLVRIIGEQRVNRIESMAMAYEGSHIEGSENEAMDSLSVEDRMSVIRIRNKTYYLNRIEEYKKEIRRLEER